MYRSYVGFGLLLHFAVKKTSTIVFLLKELLLRFIVCLSPWRNTKHFSNCSLDLASFCALTASRWLEWCSQLIKISPYGSTCRSGPQGTICPYAKRIKALWRKETLCISAQSFHLGFVPCGRRWVMSFQERRVFEDLLKSPAPESCFFLALPQHCFLISHIAFSAHCCTWKLPLLHSPSIHLRE